MPVNYVVCAAGLGLRTRGINPLIPKPLLKLRGTPLAAWALQSLDLYPGDRVIVVAQKAHRLTVLAGLLEQRHPEIDIHWLELDGPTRGQLETALASRELWNTDDPLVIYNADTFFRSRGLGPALASGDFDGLIPCSRQPGDAWSFCAVAGEYRGLPLASRVTEKERISDWCSVGYYHFRSGGLFLQYAGEYLRDAAESELYVAPMYNRLLRDGRRVGVVEVECFRPMGTPEQIREYWGLDLPALQRENRAGKIVVDLDNTLTVDASTTDYARKAPRPEIIAKLREYHALGFEIVIYSSRRMKTHGGDEGRIVAEIGALTVDWLRRHEVPFDSLKFGKPFAEHGFYVDDKAVRPQEFLDLPLDEIKRLVRSDW